MMMLLLLMLLYEKGRALDLSVKKTNKQTVYFFFTSLALSSCVSIYYVYLYGHALEHVI